MTFVAEAREQTRSRDWNRLREAIRQEGTPDIQVAWDKCERWVWMKPLPPQQGDDA